MGHGQLWVETGLSEVRPPVAGFSVLPSLPIGTRGPEGIETRKEWRLRCLSPCRNNNHRRVPLPMSLHGRFLPLAEPVAELSGNLTQLATDGPANVRSFGRMKTAPVGFDYDGSWPGSGRPFPRDRSIQNHAAHNATVVRRPVRRKHAEER
jgi:hypothetical protein